MRFCESSKKDGAVIESMAFPDIFVFINTQFYGVFISLAVRNRWNCHLWTTHNALPAQPNKGLSVFVLALSQKVDPWSVDRIRAWTTATMFIAWRFRAS